MLSLCFFESKSILLRAINIGLPVSQTILEQAKRNNILKKGNLILTGAYGPPIPINDKKLIEVTSSLFGNVFAIFK